MPHLPYWANLNFDGAMGNRAWPEVMVVRRWPMRTESGRSLSYHSFILRLVVVQVHLRRAADHVQIDDVLGLGGEVRQSGAEPPCRSARRRPSRPSSPSEASAAQPQGIGAAAEELAARLVTAPYSSKQVHGRTRFAVKRVIAHLFKHFVQIHQLVGQHGPGRQRRRLPASRRPSIRRHADQLLRIVGVGLVIAEQIVQAGLRRSAVLRPAAAGPAAVGP